jgi:hypothetical protein
MRLQYFGTQYFGGNYPGQHDFGDFAVLAAARQGLSVLSGKKYGNTLIPGMRGFSQHYNLGVDIVEGDEIYPFKLQYNGYQEKSHSHNYVHNVGVGGPWAPYRSGSTMGNSFDEPGPAGNLVDGNDPYLTHGFSSYQFGGKQRETRDVLDGAVNKGGYNSWAVGGIYVSNPFNSYNPQLEKYAGKLSPILEHDNHHTFENAKYKQSRQCGFFISNLDGYAGLWDAHLYGRVGFIYEDDTIWGSKWVIDFAKSKGIALPSNPTLLVSCITEPVKDVWGRYSWETWQGGLIVSIWGNYGTCKVDGIAQPMVEKTKEDCCMDVRGTSDLAKYYTGYSYVQLPDISSGRHVVEVDAERWEVDV